MKVKEQSESNIIWALAILAMFVIVCLICFNDIYYSSVYVDISFLYNRCYQMWDCLKHGFYPFLYYNDVGGVGYGTPIFYGQLTLLPFIPFLGSIKSFFNMYLTCCVILNFFGFRCFLKRISSSATLVSCLYVTSLPLLALLNGILPAYCLAVGFSWFFLAYCVDWFRDGKSFPLFILTYFLTWQTNLPAAIFATALCCCVFILYFRLERLLDYFLSVGCVLLVIGFDIANALYHLDAVRLSYSFSISHGCLLLSYIPFGGYIFKGVTGLDSCTGFMSIGVLAVFGYCVFKAFSVESLRFRIVSSISIAGCIFLWVIGSCPVYQGLYDILHPFYQFPVRYAVYVVGILLAIMSRGVKPGVAIYIVIGLCIVDIFVANPLYRSIPDGYVETYDEAMQVVAGEYLGKSFDIEHGFEVGGIRSETGTDYVWENKYNGVLVRCNGNPGNETLLLPKLYYRGYMACGENGEEFVVRSGYSNYCEVEIGDYQGVLSLKYSLPVWLVLLFAVQILAICYFVVLVSIRYLFGSGSCAIMRKSHC